MDGWIILIIIVGVLLGLVLLAALLYMKRVKGVDSSEMDYRMFFVLGICFISLGIVLAVIINFGLFGIAALGIVYLIISLTNRDKWKS